jgi:hypothetical protein
MTWRPVLWIMKRANHAKTGKNSYIAEAMIRQAADSETSIQGTGIAIVVFH